MIDDRHEDVRQADNRSRELEVDTRQDAMLEQRFLARGDARIAARANDMAKEYGLV